MNNIHTYILLIFENKYTCQPEIKSEKAMPFNELVNPQSNPQNIIVDFCNLFAPVLKKLKIEISNVFGA